MPKKDQRLRKKLAVLPQHSNCFYCGLPFEINPLKPNDSRYRIYSRYASMTLEHLESVTMGGATNTVDCRLAHAWCNVAMQNLPADKKSELKNPLFVFVSVTGMVPWVNKAKVYNSEKLTIQEQNSLNSVKGGRSSV